MGNAAFLAPETRTSPRSLAPPRMRILSNAQAFRTEGGVAPVTGDRSLSPVRPARAGQRQRHHHGAGSAGSGRFARGRAALLVLLAAAAEDRLLAAGFLAADL